MKKRYVAISLTLGSLALAGGAQADTWDVTQKVTVGANTTVTQGDGNTSATQAMNAIDVGAGILNGTSQAVEMKTFTLTLTQSGAETATSNQAANYVQAGTISGAFSQDVNSAAAASAIALTQSAGGTDNIQALNMADGGTVGSAGLFSQNVTPTGLEGDITLTQTTGMGADSVQAANYINGTIITSANQTVDNDTAGNGDITLVQPTGTGSITQAVNYATAGTITSLEQNIKTVDLVLDQTSGTSNVQVGNYAQATTVVDTLLSQKTDASGMIDMDQDTAGEGNLQAVNAADVKSVTVAVTQAATTGATNINLNQNNQTNSQQFVNYLTSTGTVVSVTQDYQNSDKTATLVQDEATTSQQALNAIVMTGGTDELTDGTQTVTLTTLSLSQGKITANTGSSQAANLLLSGYDIAEASQTVTADIDVTQELGTDNLQAVNLADGIDITTSLTQKINGTSDIFKQGSAATATNTNTQAGNYLAVGAAGTVASVVQDYSATASVIMDQDNITSGVQGLNVIDASASGVTVTSADQNVTVPSLTMRQGRDVATTTSVQAGNAVITDALATEGAVDQEVSVTSLAMTQTNGNRSIQAANYVGSMPY